MKAVVIPAYNPDETLLKLIDDMMPYRTRLIVVDDGSDETSQYVFETLEKRCIVLHHEKNRGKGAAMKTAFLYLKEHADEADVIGIMDCDGQHLPEDMMRVLECAEHHRKSLVLGVRTVGKDMPLRSRMGNTITRNVFRIVSGRRVSDTQTGLRAFGRENLETMLEIEGERYEYEMNMLMYFAKNSLDIQEVAIDTIYHDRKNSCSHFRAFRDSVRIYKDILKFTLSSLSSFALDYLLFAAAMVFLPHTAGYILAANVSARLVSAFYNYTMNCRFVFHTTQNKDTALEYFALAGCIFLMNNLILEVFTQTLGIPVYPAKLLTELTLFIISWMVQNLVIFRHKKTA